MADPTPGGPPLVRIDVPAHRAWLGVRELRLTFLHWRSLVLLASHAGRVLSNDEVCVLAWPSDAPGTVDSMKNLISDLREKLGDDARRPRYVITVRGIGYRFEAAMLDPDSVLAGAPTMPASVGVGDLMEALAALAERVGRLEQALPASAARSSWGGFDGAS